MICIIDYGMGNLRSVSKAVEKLGGTVEISSFPEDLERAEKIILPGVGAFGDGSAEMKKRGLFDPLRQILLTRRPFLGICLGMQLLFDESEESPGAAGLGILPGRVQRFRSPDLKIPHMGWNEMQIRQTDNPLLRGLNDRSFFYFVHSYYPVPQDPTVVAGTCEYGSEEFAALVGRDSLWAVQFHPEKSQDAGLKILENFIRL